MFWSEASHLVRTVRERSAVSAAGVAGIRPCIKGKFIFLGDEKLYVRGVAYGGFRRDGDGNEYHDVDLVERDFAQMAAHGLNAVRTYTVPPRWLLDVAQRHGLRVMVGLCAEGYLDFFGDKSQNGASDIETRVRAGVDACARHPAVLCYALGNEIPASVVRWLGPRRIERSLERLYGVAKAEDPDGLVTYANYPSTEYLHLPFLDLVCFNVYLEAQDRFEAYLARLQNLAGDRPLLLSELGLDSLRHGETGQAQTLSLQARAAFAAGHAGAFVFAWTDEWHWAGAEVDDQAFGITARDRSPKPVLAAIRDAFSDVPFPPDVAWPRISVVVCSYNGARTIRDCFEALWKLEYPNFEVIVVDDGSTDSTAAIAHEYGFRVISTENRGLSNARNTGLEAATGELVAYTDDDAYPDPHWLNYLAATFLNTTHAGVGGPNIPPAGDGPIADCVANAPGNPVHVLLSDGEAEHIPGCNMAFRKAALEAIGGFDPQFRTAGDDVDVCWRLRARGWTLGFSPAAVVWHHRRNSVRAYWRQQKGYGKAEALLEAKWPEKYNAVGHVAWAGRLYGKGLTQTLGWFRTRIYHGPWGSALFQSVYQPTPGVLASLPLLPEWNLLIVALAALCALGTHWKPLLFAAPLLALAIIAPLVQAGLSAARASFTSAPRSRIVRLKLTLLTAFLHVLQPLARLYGRLSHDLTPWRRRGMRGLAMPWPRMSAFWTTRRRTPAERLQSIEAALRATGACVHRGGTYDRWDLQLRGGLFGAARLLMAVDDYGAGSWQHVGFRSWPKCWLGGLALTVFCASLATGAALQQAWAVGAILGVVTLVLALRTLLECAAAQAAIVRVLKEAESAGK